MCGSILDRRRVPAAANIVSMPARSEEGRRAETSAQAATVEEQKPAHLADEHFSAPAAAEPPRREDEGSFSIFGVDTGGPMHAGDAPHVHGPSFLGLGDSGGNGDYLLEDEDSHGGRTFLLFVVLLIVGGLAYLQYQADTPVTSIWAAIKTRATGQQPAPPKPAAQEPVASGEQPTQPTSAKPDANPAQDNTAAQTPAADAQKQNPATPEASNASQPPADADKNSEKTSNKSAGANGYEDNAASAKAADQAAAEKPRKKGSPDMLAKAQHPQSDQDESAQDEEETSKPSRAKPSATKEEGENRQDDALVARAQGYLYGKGGAQSCNMAMSLLKQAAGRGSAKADSQLGAMYATGNCAPFDRAEAYRWFSKAAEADPRNSYLQRSRDMMWREMSPAERHKVLE